MFAARGRLVPGLEIKYLLAVCMSVCLAQSSEDQILFSLLNNNTAGDPKRWAGGERRGRGVNMF